MRVWSACSPMQHHAEACVRRRLLQSGAAHARGQTWRFAHPQGFAPVLGTLLVDEAPHTREGTTTLYVFLDLEVHIGKGRNLTTGSRPRFMQQFDADRHTTPGLGSPARYHWWTWQQQRIVSARRSATGMRVAACP